MEKLPQPGQKYLHYKGGEYIVISMAKHTETDENMVVYRSISFGSVHVRPLKIWNEFVNDENGHEHKRFTLTD